MSYCYSKFKYGLIPHSSNFGVVYIVHLLIVLSKAALQKRGFIKPMEPPLDLPLLLSNWSGMQTILNVCHVRNKILQDWSVYSGSKPTLVRNRSALH